MTCGQIIDILFESFPEDLAESWDNVGLEVGRADKEVNKVYIAVDATDKVIESAISKGADLLLTHHPMIFKPLKRVTDGGFVSRRIIKLVKNDISYVAMHTNFDICAMADEAASVLGMTELEALETSESGRGGFGRVGVLPNTITLEECARLVKDRFAIERVRLYGDMDKKIKRAAILPGSGASAIADAIRLKADVLITGDVSHHEGIDAVMQNLAVIDSGHYGIEKIFVPYMEKFFKEKLPSVEVVCAGDERPFAVV